MAEVNGGRRPVYTGRHVTVEFEMDRAGIARCAMGPELAAAVFDLADRVAKPYAVSISPRSDEPHQHYQDSFVVVPGTATIAAMRRQAARLFNTVAHAAAVEWGSSISGHRGHHVLAHTLDHLNSFGHERN